MWFKNERNKGWEPATVVQKLSMLRSYVVEGDNSGIYRRNRYYLKQTKASFGPIPNDVQDDEQHEPANHRDNNASNMKEQQEHASDQPSDDGISSRLRPPSEIQKPIRFRDDNS